MRKGNGFNRTERKLRNLVTRSVLSRTVTRKGVRRLQMEMWEGYTVDGVELVEPYGFASHAPAGAEPIVINVGGNSGRAFALLVNDRRHRIDITENQTVIFTANGDKVHIKNNGEIELKSQTQVLVDSPSSRFTGNVQIDGSLHADQAIASDDDCVSAGVSGKGHAHNETGSVTEAPNQ